MFYVYREVGITLGCMPRLVSAKKKREARDEKVKAAFDASKQRDGARRIQAELADAGETVHLKTIADSMKRQGLVAKAARKFKVTTDSAHALPVAPNILARDFTAKAPNKKWVGDITYCVPGIRHLHG